jgi:hypothetical protein
MENGRAAALRSTDPRQVTGNSKDTMPAAKPRSRPKISDVSKAFRQEGAVFLCRCGSD